MISSALPIGASGLRSSCASVARNTSLRRSASRSASAAARSSRSATSRSVTSLATESTEPTLPSTRHLGDEARLEVAQRARRVLEREAGLDSWPVSNTPADELVPLGAEIGRHAGLGVRLADEGARRLAGVGLDQRAHVGVAQRPVEAGEDERRVLDQRRELALAQRELAHRLLERGCRAIAIADVTADDQPAGRRPFMSRSVVSVVSTCSSLPSLRTCTFSPRHEPLAASSRSQRVRCASSYQRTA